MTDEEIDHTVLAMLTFGGSFVHALAECMQRADRDNLRRIIEAFPELMTQYHDLAKLKIGIE